MANKHNNLSENIAFSFKVLSYETELVYAPELMLKS